MSGLDKVKGHVVGMIVEIEGNFGGMPARYFNPKWDDQIEVLKKVLVKINEVKND